MSLASLRRAGEQLADRLPSLLHDPPIIMAIPRLGLVVGCEVAHRLGWPIDALLVHELSSPGPGGPVYGALAQGAAPRVEAAIVEALKLTRGDLQRDLELARRRLETRVAHLRGDRPMPDLRERPVVIIDDALVTGVTVEAALHALRPRGVTHVHVAAPICSTLALDRLRAQVDGMTCLEVAPVATVADRHESIAAAVCPPLTDDELRRMLRRAQREVGVDLFGGLQADE
jgi:putative phosphoribosyl transferase